MPLEGGVCCRAHALTDELHLLLGRQQLPKRGVDQVQILVRQSLGVQALPARPSLPATFSFSLVDGTAFLLAYAHKDQLIDDNGFVNFLPGGCAPAHGAPARVSHTLFRQLALTDGAAGLAGPVCAG